MSHTRGCRCFLYSFTPQARYSEADLLLQQALAIRERVQGPWHLDTSKALNYRAVLWMQQVMNSTPRNAIPESCGRRSRHGRIWNGNGA